MNAARAVILALLLGWAFTARAEVAVPPLSGRVVDQTGTLSSSDIASLTQVLRDLETRKGSQVAVLIVPTTEPESIEQYSIRVAEAWKIGRKKIDDGALLLVAKNDRKLRIEVGYGLEGALNDASAKRIIDETITPRFKSGDFAGGISNGVDRIIRVIDGEKLPAPVSAPSQQMSFPGISDVNPGFALFGTIFLAGILRTILGRLLGAAATGGVVGVMAWFVAGSLAGSLIAGIIVFIIALIVDLSSSQGSSSGGGWSGGSGSSAGSWGGSSSSDSGGFSGGGSFGGGGASGSW
jgi:uncharacterized protein